MPPISTQFHYERHFDSPRTNIATSDAAGDSARVANQPSTQKDVSNNSNVSTDAASIYTDDNAMGRSTDAPDEKNSALPKLTGRGNQSDTIEDAAVDAQMSSLIEKQNEQRNEKQELVNKGERQTDIVDDRNDTDLPKNQLQSEAMQESLGTCQIKSEDMDESANALPEEKMSTQELGIPDKKYSGVEVVTEHTGGVKAESEHELMRYDIDMRTENEQAAHTADALSRDVMQELGNQDERQLGGQPKSQSTEIKDNRVYRDSTPNTLDGEHNANDRPYEGMDDSPRVNLTSREHEHHIDESPRDETSAEAGGFRNAKYGANYLKRKKKALKKEDRGGDERVTKVLYEPSYKGTGTTEFSRSRRGGQNNLDKGNSRGLASRHEHNDTNTDSVGAFRTRKGRHQQGINSKSPWMPLRGTSEQAQPDFSHGPMGGVNNPMFSMSNHGETFETQSRDAMFGSHDMNFEGSGYSYGPFPYRYPQGHFTQHGYNISEPPQMPHFTQPSYGMFGPIPMAPVTGSQGSDCYSSYDYLHAQQENFEDFDDDADEEEEEEEGDSSDDEPLRTRIKRYPSILSQATRQSNITDSAAGRGSHSHSVIEVVPRMDPQSQEEEEDMDADEETDSDLEHRRNRTPTLKIKLKKSVPIHHRPLPMHQSLPSSQPSSPSSNTISWKLPPYEVHIADLSDDQPSVKISIPGIVREEMFLSPDHAEQEVHLLQNLFLPGQQALENPDQRPKIAVLNFHTVAVMVIEAFVQFELGDEFTTLHQHRSRHIEEGSAPIRDARNAEIDEIFFEVIDRWRAGMARNEKKSYELIRGVQEFCDIALDIIYYIKENGLLKKKRKERNDKGVKRGPQKAKDGSATASHGFQSMKKVTESSAGIHASGAGSSSSVSANKGVKRGATSGPSSYPAGIPVSAFAPPSSSSSKPINTLQPRKKAKLLTTEPHNPKGKRVQAPASKPRAKPGPKPRAKGRQREKESSSISVIKIPHEKRRH